MSSLVMLLLVWIPACTRSGMVDLRVYRTGSTHLLSGDLYAFRLDLPGPDIFLLPFTYPPFAAALFLPLSTLPFPLVAAAWTTASLLALVAFVHGSLRLAAPDTPPEQHRQRVLLWSAALMWTEPVTTTLAFGQINLLLAALVVLAVQKRPAAVAGFGVGIAAAIKLTPAVTGLYFLIRRRWAAAAWSAVAFFAAAAIGWWLAPGPSHDFWLHAVGDAARVGPVGSGLNQSLRGALSRTLGHDVGMSAPWWTATALVGVLALFAAVRSAQRSDRLGCLLAVQVFGLLASPISWSHHWVWALPALFWLLHTPQRTRWRAAAQAAWATTLPCHLAFWLVQLHPQITSLDYSWPLAVLGWAYPVCALLTLVALTSAAAPSPASLHAGEDGLLQPRSDSRSFSTASYSTGTPESFGALGRSGSYGASARTPVSGGPAGSVSTEAR
ncbi:glycosyltransferase 87 family protein [Streptomyces sp. NPDC048496]|uniref:glycosyltransferase 87 family protein n=1 Tax=Streptomyces sp. NPDC048496 TaxID=3365558 RepID=UPI00371BFDA9